MNHLTRLLFVYGTLMSTAGTALGSVERSRLAREARVVGPALMAGRLYDLGGYPGLSAETDDLIEGELLELANPDQTWPWLDSYEGACLATPAGQREYQRLTRPVFLQAGGRLAQAWVYLLIRPTTNRRRIGTRRWTGGHSP